MAATAGHRLTLNPMGKYSNAFFSETTNMIKAKLYMNVHIIFPIGSYVKTMFADGGHLGWRSGSQVIILKVDHLRTIHAMFALT
jgi:hypothetical protein